MRIRIPYTTLQDGFGGTYTSVFCRVRLGPFASLNPITSVLTTTLDSGAGRCMFNADYAGVLGINLNGAQREVTTGIGGEVPVWVHPVRLFFAGSSFVIRASFQEDLPVAGLLGMEGFFEHFIVTFDGLARECQLDRIYRA